MKAIRRSNPFPWCTGAGVGAAARINDLGHLGFRHLVGEHPADPDAVLVHVQHDAGRVFARLVEELLKHVDDELHRRVVVVQQQHSIQRRFLRLRLRLGDHRRPDAGVLDHPASVRPSNDLLTGRGRSRPHTIRYGKRGRLEGWNRHERAANRLMRQRHRRRRGPRTSFALGGRFARKIRPDVTASAPNRARSASTVRLAGQRAALVAGEEVAGRCLGLDKSAMPMPISRQGGRLPRRRAARGRRRTGSCAPSGWAPARVRRRVTMRKSVVRSFRVTDAAGDAVGARLAGDLLAERRQLVLQRRRGR